MSMQKCKTANPIFSVRRFGQCSKTYFVSFFLLEQALLVLLEEVRPVVFFALVFF